MSDYKSISKIQRHPYEKFDNPYSSDLNESEKFDDSVSDNQMNCIYYD